MSSSSAVVVILVLVALVAIGFAIYSHYRLQRVRNLQKRFGPEYERLAMATGDHRAVEKNLEQREKRVAQFHIRPLTVEEVGRYTSEWQLIQSEFVDSPKASLA